MKPIAALFLALLFIASCSNTSQKMNTVVNPVFYKTTGNDTLINFENAGKGNVPKGFSTTATGNAKSIKWNVINDNGNNVVAQQAINSGSCYNLFVLEKNSYKDFVASAKIKAVSGEEDQGGGLMWRYMDKDNYYIVRYNPLENNSVFTVW